MRGSTVVTNEFELSKAKLAINEPSHWCRLLCFQRLLLTSSKIRISKYEMKDTWFDIYF